MKKKKKKMNGKLTKKNINLKGLLIMTNNNYKYFSPFI